MKVGELMTTTVIAVGVETPLKEAARRMIEAGVSGLPVTEEGRLVGVISEADFVKAEASRRAPKRAGLLRWLVHEDRIPSTARSVGDVMTTSVISLGPDTDHSDAARLMIREGVKRLPVVDSAGSLVGIVSRSDILRSFTRPDKEIRDEIVDRLMRKVLWIDPDRIEVRVDDGNVSLRGGVENRSDADLVKEMAGRLDGVVSVETHLTWEVDNTRLTMVSPPRPGPKWH